MKISKIISNIKSISLAIFLALLIRSFVAEPFNIPSGSMKPNLLVGDFLFVSKWSYGYSKHSLPFSLPIIPGKIFSKIPNRGDVVVFKTPQDNRTDYIKRVIGLPGDKIQIIDGQININGNEIIRKKINSFFDTSARYGGSTQDPSEIDQYKEYFYEMEINVIDLGLHPLDNTELFVVPSNKFFVMGDNRDDSSDSRAHTFTYVPIENLVGKAQLIFFSLENSRFFQIWKWPKAIRFDRLMMRIK